MKYTMWTPSFIINLKGNCDLFNFIYISGILNF